MCRPGQGAENLAVAYGRRFRVSMFLRGCTHRPPVCLHRKAGVTEEDLKEPGGVVQRPLPYWPQVQTTAFPVFAASHEEGACSIRYSFFLQEQDRRNVFLLFAGGGRLYSAFACRKTALFSARGPVAFARPGRGCNDRKVLAALKETATVRDRLPCSVSRTYGPARCFFSWQVWQAKFTSALSAERTCRLCPYGSPERTCLRVPLLRGKKRGKALFRRLSPFRARQCFFTCRRRHRL